MKISKIDIMEIVPANDVLMDDLENIKGGNGNGSDFSLCIKGCLGGDSKPIEEREEIGENS